MFAIDSNTTALDVYRTNFAPRESTAEPIEELVDGEIGARTTSAERRLKRRIGPVDLLVAGPPCQGHSDLNNHTRRADPKNELILRVVRFAELFRPLHVLIENVQGIRHDKTGSLALTKAVLTRLGYDVEEGLVRADAVGVAQTRRRFFLFASRNGAHPFERLPRDFKSSPRTVEWAIGDLRREIVGDAFDSAARASEQNRERIRYLFRHDLHDLPDRERPPCHASGGHRYQAVYGRMWWDRPAPTITRGFGSAGQGRFVHPVEPRTLTPHEAARLQFFPDFFDFGARRRSEYQDLVGNAVPPKLAYAILLHQLA